MEDVKLLIAELQELQLVHTWLQRINAKVHVQELPPITQLHSMRFTQVTDCVTAFKNGLKLDENVLILLRFFLKKKSLLFDTVTSQFLANEPTVSNVSSA